MNRHLGALKNAHYEALIDRVADVCERVLTSDMLKQKFHINEIADNLGVKVNPDLLQHILEVLCLRGSLGLSNGYYQLTAKTDRFSDNHRQTIKALLDFAEDSGKKPFSAGNFCKTHQGKYPKKRWKNSCGNWSRKTS